MARPQKVGLEYFPLDCRMDDKIEMLEAEFGLTGFAVYIKLLQEIYQTEFGELDMSVVFRWKTLGKRLDMSVNELENIVYFCLEVNLFDKECFQNEQKLTSGGIQKRLGKVAGMRQNDRNRKNKTEPEFSAGKLPENAIKGKGKGKDIKISKEVVDVPDNLDKTGGTNPSNAIDTAVKKNGNGQMVKPDLPTLMAFVLSREGGTETMAVQMFDFYTSKGWKVGNSPMADWNAAARKWVSNNTTASQVPMPRSKSMVV
ncbi:hypothetical protein GCM10028808_60760 [Spirosoma migulaei]